MVVGWLLLFISQNPGYMKENFIIIIESLHLADAGMQHNVSPSLCAVDSQSASWFLAQTPVCYDLCHIHHDWYKINASGFFFSETIISYNEIYIYHGYIFYEREIILPQSFLHYQHTFSTFA